MRTPEISLQQKKSALQSAIGNACTVLPILCFQVSIADKLEGELKFPYIIICSPLLVAVFTLTILSFSAKSGNKWWFGIRKNFSQFLLSALPSLQEYGNISYHTETGGQTVPLNSNVQLDDFD